MQLKINALKDAAAWPGARQRAPLSCSPASSWPPSSTRRAIRAPGAGPVNGKETQMNTRSPYPDVEVPEISPSEFVPDRADVRGAAVPLMGPADHGSASPLMGPPTAGTATPLMGPPTAGTATPLMGPAAPATATPLMGPADCGTTVPLMGPPTRALPHR